MKTGHSMGRVKQGSKENEYDWYTCSTRMNLEYGIFKPVEITIRRGLR
jgi:hypothetical protein